MNETQHGHLLLADISGYTSYVATTELTHSQEILTDLLETIIAQFKPMLTISKIEGDAVFAYIAEAQVPRGEAILELIEATYGAFRSRQEAAHRRTTCTCNACRNIPNLDLKFFSHHGDYFVQAIAGTKELVGSDVNLIHRLAKNHLSEQTGWRAYAMFSEQSLQHLHLQLEGLHHSVENYEHLGEVHVMSMNMHGRYQELMAARRVVISSAEAHYILEKDYEAAPSRLWEWFNDPHKRGQWMTSEIVPVLRVGGRSGTKGARNHCVHGNHQIVVEDILDIKPYEYFTVAHVPQGSKASLQMTFYFKPLAENKTRLTLAFKAHAPNMPNWFDKIFCRFILRAQILKLWKFDLIASGLAQEAAPA